MVHKGDQKVVQKMTPKMTKKWSQNDYKMVQDCLKLLSPNPLATAWWYNFRSFSYHLQSLISPHNRPHNTGTGRWPWFKIALNCQRYIIYIFVWTRPSSGCHGFNYLSKCDMLVIRRHIAPTENAGILGPSNFKSAGTTWKLAPNGSKKGPKMTSKWFKIAPKTAQDSPKWVTKGPKMTPKWFKIALNCPRYII